jgi:hypothetical protein
MAIWLAALAAAAASRPVKSPLPLGIAEGPNALPAR